MELSLSKCPLERNSTEMIPKGAKNNQKDLVAVSVTSVFKLITFNTNSVSRLLLQLKQLNQLPKTTPKESPYVLRAFRQKVSIKQGSIAPWGFEGSLHPWT